MQSETPIPTSVFATNPIFEDEDVQCYIGQLYGRASVKASTKEFDEGSKLKWTNLSAILAKDAATGKQTISREICKSNSDLIKSWHKKFNSLDSNRTAAMIAAMDARRA